MCCPRAPSSTREPGAATCEPEPGNGRGQAAPGGVEWVEAIRAGDPSAFEALFHAYHAGMCAFAYRYLGARDLAEEIVQEVFLCVWERRETWHISTSVRSYLTEIDVAPGVTQNPGY